MNFLNFIPHRKRLISLSSIHFIEGAKVFAEKQVFPVDHMVESSQRVVITCRKGFGLDLFFFISCVLVRYHRECRGASGGITVLL